MISRRGLIKGMLALGGSLIPRFVFPSTGTGPWRNWSGHLVAYPASRFAPVSEDELVDWMKSSTGTLRPVGAVGQKFSETRPID